MTRETASYPHQIEDWKATLERAALAVPPAWPLASSVAVNPFLGQSRQRLIDVGARLARIAGASVTMPRSWYQEKIAAGAITDEDLGAALMNAHGEPRPSDLPALKAALAKPSLPARSLPTIADLAATASDIDWPGIIAERLGAWAAGYFDEGQALWVAPKGRTAYAAWKAFATHDLTPEILGLPGFALHVSEAPESAPSAVERVANRLGLTTVSAESYFHQLLIALGGWSQYARFKRWEAELVDSADDTITDLLAVRLLWEEALFLRYQAQIAEKWTQVCAEHAAPSVPSSDLVVDAVLQEAAERAAQRRLAAVLKMETPPSFNETPVLQVAFCIDVRSEVFRRALESVDSRISTLGFAGFFGVATAHRRFASDSEEKRLPVLLKPAVSSRAGGVDARESDLAARFRARATRAWGRFKLAAVSSFAFVEAAGPTYAVKLLGDALGVRSSTTPSEPPPRFEPSLGTTDRIGAAETILRAMSLTTGFARLIVVAGHGANVVNNPHASALHCGACGGYSGEVNARLLTSLLNDPEVRNGLARRGIVIPPDTLFVAALHLTTTDEIVLYADDHPSDVHAPDLERARGWFAAAGRIARTERVLRLPRASQEADLHPRSRDWAETRPEWALAGCQAFIAAPRRLTIGKNLAGSAFLHDYDWRQDEGFRILELILTAPVVVASWISLQYYGSTVAPEIFGGGNKLLHNITGGFGVVEGNGGTLRVGLPWQSVHDGERYVHEPLRLAVCISASSEVIGQILSRHPDVRALFDNRWLYLFALDDTGAIAQRYIGDLRWESCNDEP